MIIFADIIVIAMKYTRNQINKAGEILLSAKSSKEYDDALLMINDWRSNHLVPLNELKNEILNILKKESLKPILISQRLKRMSSIQYKLDLNPEMRLGGVQDIGGMRAVFSDMLNLSKIKNSFSRDIGNFEYQRTTDYIEQPKDSGYRSIHYIYKYKSTDERYNGLRIELQIRTQLQHNWATALETVDIHTKTALKSGQGDDAWIVFFQIISSLYALKEGCNVLKEHKGYDIFQIMKMYYAHIDYYKSIALLRAFRVVSSKFDEIYKGADYYVLQIDSATNMLKIHPYKASNHKEAVAHYYSLEAESRENRNLFVVLVSTSSYKLLREAYPSYFSDLTSFIDTLEKIEKNCKRLGLT